MKIDASEIISPVYNVLKPLGFAKIAKRKWFRETSEVFQELRLIKSTWDQKNWLEARFAVRKFCTDKKPDFGSMFYFAEALPDKRRLECAFDLDCVDMTAVERLETIESTLKDYVVPVLIKAETEIGVRDAFLEIKNLMVFRMHKKTQQDFGIWEEPKLGA